MQYINLNTGERVNIILSEREALSSFAVAPPMFTEKNGDEETTYIRETNLARRACTEAEALMNATRVPEEKYLAYMDKDVIRWILMPAYLSGKVSRYKEWKETHNTSEEIAALKEKYPEVNEDGAETEESEA